MTDDRCKSLIDAYEILYRVLAMLHYERREQELVYGYAMRRTWIGIEWVNCARAHVLGLHSIEHAPRELPCSTNFELYGESA